MPGLLDAAPLDLAQAARHLQELRGRGGRLLGVAFALAVIGVLLLLLSAPNAGIPLLVGAAAAVFLAWIVASDRRRLLIRLIAQGDATGVEGVPELAQRLCSQRERRRLAGGLRVAATSGQRGEQSLVMVDPGRASDVSERLVLLADALADPARSVTSRAVALGRSLLIDPMRSPLYNPNVPERELVRVLDVIERGVS
jgi:hypothetical protein